MFILKRSKFLSVIIIFVFIFSITLPNFVSANSIPIDTPTEMTEFLQIRADPYVYLDQETRTFKIKSAIDNVSTRGSKISKANNC